MSALGQKQTLAHVRVMSALPPKADIGQLNDLTGGGSFSVEARADAAILVAERERVATE